MSLHQWLVCDPRPRDHGKLANDSHMNIRATMYQLAFYTLGNLKHSVFVLTARDALKQTWQSVCMTWMSITGSTRPPVQALNVDLDPQSIPPKAPRLVDVNELLETIQSGQDVDLDRYFKSTIDDQMSIPIALAPALASPVQSDDLQSSGKLRNSLQSKSSSMTGQEQQEGKVRRSVSVKANKLSKVVNDVVVRLCPIRLVNEFSMAPPRDENFNRIGSNVPTKISFEPAVYCPFFEVCREVSLAVAVVSHYAWHSLGVSVTPPEVLEMVKK
jgi:hypothetical protein